MSLFAPSIQLDQSRFSREQKLDQAEQNAEIGVALSTILLIGGVWLTLAVYRVFPKGPNALSNLGKYGKVICFGTLGGGALLSAAFFTRVVALATAKYYTFDDFMELSKERGAVCYVRAAEIADNEQKTQLRKKFDTLDANTLVNLKKMQPGDFARELIAEQLYALEKYEEAIKVLAGLSVKQDLLILSYLKNQQYESAQTFLTPSLLGAVVQGLEGSQDDKVWLVVARKAYGAKKWKIAANCFGKAEAMEATDRLIWIYALRQLRDYTFINWDNLEELAPALEQSTDPQKSEVALHLGKKFYKEKKYRAADAFFKESKAANPEKIANLIKLQKRDEADRVLRCNPHFIFEVKDLLGGALHDFLRKPAIDAAFQAKNKKRWEEVEKLYRLADSIAPLENLLRFQWMRALVELKRFEEAEKIPRSDNEWKSFYTTLNPGGRLKAKVFGMHFYRKKEFALARACFQVAPQALSNSEKGCFADCLIKRNRIEEAEKVLEGVPATFEALPALLELKEYYLKKVSWATDWGGKNRKKAKEYLLRAYPLIQFGRFRKALQGSMKLTDKEMEPYELLAVCLHNSEYKRFVKILAKRSSFPFSVDVPGARFYSVQEARENEALIQATCPSYRPICSDAPY